MQVKNFGGPKNWGPRSPVKGEGQPGGGQLCMDGGGAKPPAGGGEVAPVGGSGHGKSPAFHGNVHRLAEGFGDHGHLIRPDLWRRGITTLRKVWNLGRQLSTMRFSGIPSEPRWLARKYAGRKKRCWLGMRSRGGGGSGRHYFHPTPKGESAARWELLAEKGGSAGWTPPQGVVSTPANRTPFDGEQQLLDSAKNTEEFSPESA